MKGLQHVGIGAVIALLGFMMWEAPSAQACGGFFCNGVTQTPIYQAGERVLFARHDDRVTMHIEINYSGDDPTEFAWVLPLPEVPTDGAGIPLPLDKAVSISSEVIFDTLQNLTNPQFSVNYMGIEDPYDCREAIEFAVSAPSFDSGGYTRVDAASNGGGGAPPAPAVVVLQEAKVGPYNAQLVEATDAQKLYEWLNENGYYQDPNALPILEHYVGESYVFVGIKLQSDKTDGDLKPLAISLSEDAPCVPLRLTGIAATADMPLFVWVLGESRAVPKNFIHAVVNDQAIQFPSAANYVEVVNQAVDTASGRAWVTEFAGDAEPFRGQFLPADAHDTSGIESAETCRDVWDDLHPFVRNNPTLGDILRAHVPMPEGLVGYPYGNCYYSPWFEEEYGYYYWYDCPEDNESHLTTEGEFYTYLDFWFEQEDLEIPCDLQGLQDAILAEIIEPLMGVEELFAEGATLTRFYTTQGPEEMTRDPIFAFNATLEDVPRAHQVDVLEYWGWDCSPYKIVTYPDGRRYTFDDCDAFGCSNFIVDPVPGSEALLYPEVMDEWGPPIPFDAGQALTVDGTLSGDIGEPNMPDDFPWDPAEEDTEKPTWPNPPPGYYVNNPETRPDYEEPASGNLADVTADEALGDDGMGCGSAVATGGLTWLLLAFMATCLGRLRRRRDAGAR